MQPYNIVTFFKRVGYDLETITTIPVSNLSLKRDIISLQTSSFSCKYIDDVKKTDYGIMKNADGQNIFFKITNKEYSENDDKMILTVLTYNDILDFDVFFPGAEQSYYIADLINFLNDRFNYLYGMGGHRAEAYRFQGDLMSMYFPTGQDSIYSMGAILNRALNIYNFKTNIALVNKRLVVNVSEYIPEEVTLNLEDKNICGKINFIYGQDNYNILQLFTANWPYGGERTIYGRILKDEMIIVYDNAMDYPYGLEVHEDGTLGSTNIRWDLNVPDREIMSSQVYNWDTSLTDAENEIISLQILYSNLKAQGYNHQIEVPIYLNNSKIDVTDFENLMTINFILLYNGLEIKTNITKYEYSGGNILMLTFGNVRYRLTEKIMKMKGA